MRSDTVYFGRDEKQTAFFRRLEEDWFVLDKETADILETLVSFYQNTRRHTPKHRDLNSRRQEKEEPERMAF
jgi:hypothetical protein